jgi:hypothetical protein
MSEQLRRGMKVKILDYDGLNEKIVEVLAVDSDRFKYKWRGGEYYVRFADLSDVQVMERA